MKSIATSILLTLFGIVISLGIVEVGYRALSLFSSPPKTWSDRPAIYFNPTDSLSMQGNTYSKEKKDGVFRVAVIGDSFTFAPHMQFNDAFPAKLEALLEMSGKDSIEVINYGVPGYSTSHEVNETKKAADEGADLVILQITLNDPQRKSYQPTGLTGKNEFGPYKPNKRLAAITKYWSSLDYALQRLHNTETHRRYVEYYFDLFSNKKNWDSFAGSISRIKKVSKKRSVPLVAVVFPLFGLELDENYPFHDLHRKVESVLAKNKIPTLDLYKAYEGIPLHRLQVIPGADFHPNETGHRIAAEEIYLWLRSQAVIPEQYFAAKQFRTRTDIRLLEANMVE